MRFSKSFRKLELIRQNDIEPIAIFFLNYKFSRKELADIVKTVIVSLWDILHSHKNLLIKHMLPTTSMSEVETVDITIRFVKLLERPIVTDNILLLSNKCPGTY